ncbi:MAG: flagellar basal body P-ring formation chaperone FlgA [bacterium]
MKTVYFRLVVLILFLMQIPAPVLAQKKLSASANELPRLELSEKIIKQRIELYLLKNYQKNHDEVLLEFESLPTPIAVDPLDWEIKVEKKYGRVKAGANLLDVTIFSKRAIYKKFVTTVRLKTFDHIVVAASRLNKGQQMAEENLAFRRTETTNLQRKYFTSVAEVASLQTKKMVADGKPIFVDTVELPDIIHRGDVVRLIVKLKNLHVTATAKALENGRRGEKITVENLTTGKKLTGLIENEKTVVVEL